MTIVKWEDRLSDMDTSKGVSHQMRFVAMRAEVRELRVALRTQTARADKWAIKAASQSKKRLDLARVTTERDDWKAAALKYQKRVLNKLKGETTKPELPFGTKLHTSPQPQKPLTDEIPKGVLLAISNAGLTLLKTQHGYELRKLGPIEAAHNIKE